MCSSFLYLLASHFLVYLSCSVAANSPSTVTHSHSYTSTLPFPAMVIFPWSSFHEYPSLTRISFFPAYSLAFHLQYAPKSILFTPLFFHLEVPNRYSHYLLYTLSSLAFSFFLVLLHCSEKWQWKMLRMYDTLHRHRELGKDNSVFPAYWEVGDTSLILYERKLILMRLRDLSNTEANKMQSHNVIPIYLRRKSWWKSAVLGIQKPLECNFKNRL